MTKKTISITRALVELTRLGDRINQAISQGTYVSRTQGKEAQKKVVGSNKTVADVTKDIQGSFDKVESLIKNRAALKAAIVLSNAETKVEVAGTEMTVAEAIELKSSVTYRESFLYQVRTQFTNAQSAVERDNAKLEEVIQALLTTAYGADKTKITEDTVKAISDPQRNSKEFALLDPVDAAKKIESLTEEVQQIKGELDFVLSESNARTEIEVELG